VDSNINNEIEVEEEQYKQIAFPRGTTFEQSSLYKEGNFLSNATEGLLVGVAKLGYDTFKLGTDIGNSVTDNTRQMELYNMPYGAVPESNSPDKDPHKLELDDFWDVYNDLRVSGDETYDPKYDMAGSTRLIGEITPIMISAHAMGSQLAKLPALAKYAAASPKGVALATDIIAGAPADFIHVSKTDQSIFSLIPQENRPEFLEWFTNRDDDTSFDNRFKSMIEGGMLGGLAHSFIAPFTRMMNKSKNIVNNMNTGSVDDLIVTTDEVLANGSGEIVEAMNKKSVVGSVMEGGELSHPKTLQKLDTDIPPEIPLREAKMRTESATSELPESLDALNPLAKPSRIAEDNYSLPQVLDDLPMRDTLRGGLDAKSIRESEDIIYYTKLKTAKGTKRARETLEDATASDYDKALAREFIDQDIKGMPRSNPATSGVDSLAEGVEMMTLVARSSGLKPRTTSVNENVFNTFKKLNEGTLGQSLTKQITELGYDDRSVKKLLSHLVDQTEDVEQIITAARDLRFTKAKATRVAIKEMMNRGVVPGSKEFNKFMGLVTDLDSFDALIQGQVGSAARIMRFQQLHPSDFAKAMLDGSREARKTALAATVEETTTKAGKKALKEAESLIDELDKTPMLKQLYELSEGGSTMSAKQTEELLNALVAAIDSPKALNKVLRNPQFNDLLGPFALGNMLASVPVQASAIIGNVASTILKTIIVPTIDGAIQQVFRGSGVKGVGGRMIDGFIGAKVLLEGTGKLITNAFAGKNRVPIRDLYHVRFEAYREGMEQAVKTSASYRFDMENLSKYYAANDMYVKSSMINLLTPMVSKSLGVTSMFARGMTKIDDYFKGINNAAQMSIAAERAYLSEGADLMKLKGITQKEFVTRFNWFQQSLATIINDKDLTTSARLLKVDSLFSGNSRLEELVTKSIQDAQEISKEITLQSDPKGLFGRHVMSLTKELKKTPQGHMALLMVMPFQKTPVNLLEEAIAHSPAAVCTRRFLTDVMHGTPEVKAKALARMGSGLGIMLGVSQLNLTDRLTGKFEPNEREAMRAAGRSEYSIRIGETWYDYTKLGPIGTYLSATHAYFKMQNAQPDDNHLSIINLSLAAATNNSYLDTINEMIELAQMEKTSTFEKTQKFIMNQSTRVLIPLSGTTNSVVDAVDIMNGGKWRIKSDADKDYSSYWSKENQARIAADAFKSNPMLSTAMGAFGLAKYSEDLDVLGKPIAYHGQTTGSKILKMLGVGTMDENRSVVVGELFKYNIIPQTHSTRTVNTPLGSVTLNENQSKKLSNYLWSKDLNLSAELEQIIQSKLYYNHPLGDEGRSQWLKTIVEENMKIAKQIVFGKDPKIEAEAYKDLMWKLYQRSTAVPATIGSDGYWNSLQFQKDNFMDTSGARAEEVLEKVEALGFQK
jgi:hypothetical protein